MRIKESDFNNVGTHSWTGGFANGALIKKQKNYKNSVQCF